MVSTKVDQALSKKEPENKSKLSVVEIIVVMKDIATILLATYQWLK